MTALLALLVTAAPSDWVLSDVVDDLNYREKVSAVLAKAATERLAAGQPLEAQVAAETCLRIDRYRCSCIREAGLAIGTMPSADATTSKAVHQNAASSLWEYVSCDETAGDAPSILKTANQWAGPSKWPYPLAPVDKAVFDATPPAQLLEDGNERFKQLVPLEAKHRFEACATRQPVSCECARRAGDAWLKLDDRQRAFVWWSRYLDCDPKAADRALVAKDLEAAKTALGKLPPWRGPSSEPSTSVQISTALGRKLLEDARKAAADKRLDDAVVSYTACKLLDYKAFDCTLELGQTLQKLDRLDEAKRVHRELEAELPPKDPRRAALSKLP
jgi:tetratricopeptide (TPR) repeat protein